MKTWHHRAIFGTGSAKHYISLIIMLAAASCAFVPPMPRHSQAVAIVNTAQSQLGAPYVLGGDSPETGFDCSGFVKWAYAQHGFNLPRTTNQQINSGRRIADIDRLTPGDLIFFNLAEGGRRQLHVGLYVGAQTFIHSPRVGKHIEKTRLSDWWREHFYLGRRIVY